MPTHGSAITTRWPPDATGTERAYGRRPHRPTPKEMHVNDRTVPARRRGAADGVRVPGRRGGRGDAQRRAGRDGRQARPLPRRWRPGVRRPPTELAERTGLAERYVREWCNAQAAGGFVDYDPEGCRYSLAPEQAIALTDSDSPAFLPGFFQVALGSVLDSPRIIEAARSGAGVGWHEHSHDVFDGCERFFRPGYNANLVPSWLPALDGVVEKLERGAKVADLGCGHGSSTILMAQAFPNSTFVGPTTTPARSRPPASARRRPASAIASRFEQAPAANHPGSGYDLVTMFDCLHDMGDPVGAARHVRDVLAPDGTWMIVEPNAGDRDRGQPQPRRARLLRVLDAAVHAGVALAGGRARARRAGRRGADPRRRHRRRADQVPPRGGDAVQPRVRGSALGGALGSTDGPDRHRDPRAPPGRQRIRRARRGPGLVGGATAPARPRSC